MHIKHMLNSKLDKSDFDCSTILQGILSNLGRLSYSNHIWKYILRDQRGVYTNGWTFSMADSDEDFSEVSVSVRNSKLMKET